MNSGITRLFSGKTSKMPAGFCERFGYILKISRDDPRVSEQPGGYAVFINETVIN
jgi:hypothetical protein